MNSWVFEDAEAFQNVTNVVLALKYHAWPGAARSIAMMCVDKLSYPRQQTRGN